VLAGVEFVEKTFTDPGEVLKSGSELPLDRLKDEKVKAAARRVLAVLGKKDATSIALADIDAHGKIVAEQKLNGDGVIPPESIEDPEARKVVEEILDTIGGADDRSGKKGVG